MGSHPLNLALRFLLEIAAYLAMAYWGWTQNTGIMRVVWTIGLPFFWMILWAIFAVPNDPSRSGKAPVPVPGFARLVLEAAYFASATWAINASGFNLGAIIFAVVVVTHYLLSYDRIRWLLRQK
ncbi:MAG: YrdB family protein [Anaerolineales bacterium]|nr:YrdB family protein [Anaerolineales bacterium]